eukprot:CAMPEP_0206003678 /NCGR_PEP_ID=MMETSP1464-20131121/3526_1 /ASSEMBLY_ACC=CAM_ASM_001124 /TAXON_ID=119497 /ORGANISM="Exanthemachrysis gayraliae, Strain RCC1523" /LENGTH=187 /DNA_ID=CAMNT_0053377061 /DNA_START=102 /DNA_END=661 /DNA_ORIENTATION=+
MSWPCPPGRAPLTTCLTVQRHTAATFIGRVSTVQFHPARMARAPSMRIAVATRRGQGGGGQGLSVTRGPPRQLRRVTRHAGWRRHGSRSPRLRTAWRRAAPFTAERRAPARRAQRSPVPRAARQRAPAARGDITAGNPARGPHHRGGRFARSHPRPGPGAQARGPREHPARKPPPGARLPARAAAGA